MAIFKIYSLLSGILQRNKSGASYVSLTVASTLISFIKGFVLMRYLTLSDLGIITLVSATMGLFSMLQLGFLNGGYRIFSEQHKDRSVVTDIVYSYFMVIEIVAISGITLMYFIGSLSGTEVLYALLASVFGILLVLNNWNRNMLIASKRVNEVNRLNLTSIIVSFIFLFTVPFWGLYGALLVTFSIELIFYILAIWRSRQLLPSNLNFNFKQYKWVLSFGFLPFLAGIISTYNMQVETWSIASFISTEALGTFYLPKLYIQLFFLIPGALNQLFYPEAIKAYTESNYAKVKNVLKKFVFVNASVSIFLVMITLLFLKPVIAFFIPIHVVGIPFIWIILPGLVINTILQPIDLVFYASNILRPLLWVSIIGVAFTTISLLSAGFLGSLTLTFASTIKSVFYVVASSSVVIFYMINRKRIWGTV